MKPSPPLSRSVLDRLRQFDTPTICNVIELFDIRPRQSGYMDGRIQACYPKLPPMVGFASTATFRSAAPPQKGDVYSGLDPQVEMLAKLPGPPVIVFQDLDNPSASATFGEVMCSTYKAFGAAGLITSGAGRDLDQVEVLNFPCFTNGTICAHGYCHIPQLHVPVHVGGVTIYVGDLLHGDRNGVTTIPLSIAEAAADACGEFAAAETVVLEYVKGGDVTPAGYATARKECQRRIEELARRFRSTTHAV